MDKLIDLTTYPVRNVLDLLLKDKTTKQNIIFATDVYSERDLDIGCRTHISKTLLFQVGYDAIQPRVLKSQAEQSNRTRTKAEVFTPSWICNKMNNHCDEEWFGRKGVFNNENEENHTWNPTRKKISFKDSDGWEKYVLSKRLEITCGEAPYIVSRYDTSTGKPIPIKRRIGILDRKLRVVNENTESEEEWFEWVIKAYQSTYGYEFQGDNLLIARINLLVTFTDYLMDRWGRKATETELKKIANIIVWNIWQMDGLTGNVPFGRPPRENVQLSFFDSEQGEDYVDGETMECRIFDWRSDKSITYNSMKRENK